MKKSLLFPLILLFLSGCFSDDFEEYDDTQDLAFLEEYRLEEGVMETNSGLLYKIIKEGEGSKPASDDIAVFDLIAEHVVTGDGFDTHDIGYPEVAPLEMLTPHLTGLQEAIQLMNIGSVYELVLSSELAWRDGRVYSFEVELHTTQKLFIADYASRDDVSVTDSGLLYRIIEEGEGESPNANSQATIHYTGTLINGNEFDSGTSELRVGQYIEGFSEGLQLMTPGSTYEFLIPPDIAYTDPSNPGPAYFGAALLFEVELVSFQD